MTIDPLSRRHFLKTSLLTAVGFTGCISRNGESRTNFSPTSTEVETLAPGTTTDDATPTVASLAVSDFICYPLSGTHPHVYRRANTQYVVVRLNASVPMETLQNRLTFKLDNESVPRSERQPVPWRHDTLDMAYAVPKGNTFESGRVLFDQTALHSLSNPTLKRLNTPPVFEVTAPSVSPTEVHTGDQVEATVEFTVTNTGNGRGEFGASLKGNFISGANTLTATLEAGEEQVITGTTQIVGNGDTATIRLDWGTDEWTIGIPVVGT